MNNYHYMELRIGAPFTYRGYRNLFKLVVSCLHDNSGRTSFRTVLIEEDQVEKYKDFIRFLIWCSKRYPDKEEIAARIQQLEDKHNFRFSGLVDGSCVVGGRWHSVPMLDKLSYFDEAGVERHVDILNIRD